MNKKIVITILIICICLMFCIPTFVCAAELSDIYGATNDGFDDPAFKGKVESILGLIQVIGYVTAVIMAIVIGMRFIFASPEGKAELRKTMFPYIIGCLILAGGTAVVSVIALFGYQIN